MGLSRRTFWLVFMLFDGELLGSWRNYWLLSLRLRFGCFTWVKASELVFFIDWVGRRASFS